MVSPEMGSCLGVDQLGGDAHTVAEFPHATFGHVSHTELSPDLLHVDGTVLVGEAGLPGDDEQPADARQAVKMSSTMPSAKYSCSGSPLMLANGKTAIEGMSGGVG